MPTTPDDELRQKILDIWGLETDPDGIPEQMLIRNEVGTITGGFDYSEEVNETMQLLADQRRRDAAAIKAMGPKNLALYPKDHRLSVEEIAEYNAPREQINDMNKRWRAAVDAVLLEGGV
jgi:hypothetical protein